MEYPLDPNHCCEDCGKPMLVDDEEDIMSCVNKECDWCGELFNRDYRHK